MSATLCHGCGQRLEVPAGYAKAKLRCPECGVMCDVPPPEARKGPVKQSAGRAAPTAAPRPAPPVPAVSPEDGLVPLAPEPVSESRPARPTPPPVPADDDLIPLAPEPAPAPPPPTLPVDFGTDEDDGKPYRVSGPPEKKCPHCSKRLESDALQCPGCGYDLQAGKKPKKVYEPAERSWEAGWPLHQRRLVFILGIIIGVALGIPISIASDSWVGGIISWIVFITLGSFLLGTYPRVDLARNKRGKVTLTKTWRVCFLEQKPIEFNVIEFEGVRTGYARDVSLIDWIAAAVLLPAGIVPGILWWYIFIQRDQHTVALLREHGYASDILYRGISEDLAKDMAQEVHEIGGLRYENG
jgi:DNA-directed RNA polymerase subunit RPC12/RpoP